MNAEAPYGIAAVFVCLLAWFAKDHAMQKMSMVLLTSWAVSNFLFGTMTPPHLLAANAIMDAVGMSVSMIALRPAKNTRYSIAFLYIVMLTCHLIWLAIKPTPYFYYFVALNVLYALQLAVMGGACVNCIYTNWRHSHSARSLGVWGQARTQRGE